MKEFRITIDGKTYNVQVEEVRGAASAVQPVLREQVPQAAPVPAVMQAPAQAQPQKEANESRPVGTGSGSVNAPMPGTVLKVLVAVGDQVKLGQPVLILDAMKMENNINASASGIVKSIDVNAGQSVDTGQQLLTIE